jgi:hypothetical protein
MNLFVLIVIAIAASASVYGILRALVAVFNSQNKLGGGRAPNRQLRQGQRQRRRRSDGTWSDDDDDWDTSSSSYDDGDNTAAMVLIADRLERMADRFLNAGHSDKASQATALAESIRNMDDLDSARRAERDFMREVGSPTSGGTDDWSSSSSSSSSESGHSSHSGHSHHETNIAPDPSLSNDSSSSYNDNS